METLEIPVINRISGFEAGFNRLRNPSFISRAIDLLLGNDEIFLNYKFWTWGALILAILATFSGVINRTKLVILRFYRRQRSVDSVHFLLRPLVDDDEDDNDETCSPSSSNDEDENQRLFDEDICVVGSGSYDEDQVDNRLKLRRRFSWSDFAGGKSVVRLWDGLGLGLGLRFDGSSTESVVSMWDLNKNEIINSFYGGGAYQIPTISRAAPSVGLTAGLEESGNVAFRVWDARLGRQIPAIFAELQPRWRRTVAIDSDEVEKVYVTDDSNAVTVRDIRKVGFPIESEEDTWWDSDAVIVSDADREPPVKIRGSVLSRNLSRNLSRCRDAVKSYLF
ncbi:uncharacterized protein LOC122665765 [Telopea speciosissima]|uniref:uncharacterized protein LOC122665765 n=1 Tax=Telopea speciosissima TaxID=54955 RepID=UPI001CC667FC|nr:uncharacterized protein LOC122665765 [Telopea speciosissima]